MLAFVIHALRRLFAAVIGIFGIFQAAAILPVGDLATEAHLDYGRLPGRDNDRKVITFPASEKSFGNRFAACRAVFQDDLDSKRGLLRNENRPVTQPGIHLEGLDFDPCRIGIRFGLRNRKIHIGLGDRTARA